MQQNTSSVLHAVHLSNNTLQCCINEMSSVMLKQLGEILSVTKQSLQIDVLHLG